MTDNLDIVQHIALPRESIFGFVQQAFRASWVLQAPGSIEPMLYSRPSINSRGVSYPRIQAVLRLACYASEFIVILTALNNKFSLTMKSKSQHFQFLVLCQSFDLDKSSVVWRQFKTIAALRQCSSSAFKHDVKSFHSFHTRADKSNCCLVLNGGLQTYLAFARRPLYVQQSLSGKVITCTDTKITHSLTQTYSILYRYVYEPNNFIYIL